MSSRTPSPPAIGNRGTEHQPHLAADHGPGSTTAQVAFARAFGMSPLRGVQKSARGAWLVLLLADTAASLTLRPLIARPPLSSRLIAAACCWCWSSGSSWSAPGCCWICRSRGVTWYPARPSVPSRAPPSTPERCSPCATGSASTGTPRRLRHRPGADRGRRHRRLLLGLDRRRHGRLLGAQSRTRRSRRHRGTIGRHRRVIARRPSPAALDGAVIRGTQGH